ncbi:hypothetical protein B0H14DRAFT_3441258 [Mycena olivaceomarginata]|nr:hypothetical protein B0H14DRAFT_3441258 [Mycena olivaceomarginata]
MHGSNSHKNTSTVPSIQLLPDLRPRIKGAVHQHHPLSASLSLPNPCAPLACLYAPARIPAATPVPSRLAAASTPACSFRRCSVPSCRAPPVPSHPTPMAPVCTPSTPVPHCFLPTTTSTSPAPAPPRIRATTPHATPKLPNLRVLALATAAPHSL